MTDESQTKQNNNQLSKQNAMLQNILDELPAGIFCFDNQGKLTFINRYMAHYIPSAAPLLHSRSWVDLIHQGDVNRVLDAWRVALGNNSNLQIDFRLPLAKGKSQWVHGKFTRFLNQFDKEDLYLCCMMNIDNHKSLEADLWSQKIAFENQNQGLIQRLGDAATANIMMLDDDNDLLEAFKKLGENYKVEVLVADNIFAGLEILRTRKIQLAVIDYLMPEMNGLKFIEQGKIISPETLFVIASGFYQDINSSLANDSTKPIVISKPYSFETIQSLIPNKKS